MTLRNKMRARRPAERRRPRAGVPAQGRVDLCPAALDHHAISNRNISRLAPVLTPLKSGRTPFLTATKLNFSFPQCVASHVPAVSYRSRCSNPSGSRIAFLIDRASQLEFGATHCKQRPELDSNRRWIAVSEIYKNGSLRTPCSEAIRCSPALFVAGGSRLRARGAAADSDPFEKSFHARAFAPHQSEKSARIEVRRFLSEERLHAPADVGRSPRREPMPFRDDPVVAQGVQHCEGEFPGDSTMRCDNEGFR